MAKKRQKKDNKPRENAVKNNGSAAGKRSEQGATAARTAPPKAPAKVEQQRDAVKRTTSTSQGEKKNCPKVDAEVKKIAEQAEQANNSQKRQGIIKRLSETLKRVIGYKRGERDEFRYNYDEKHPGYVVEKRDGKYVVFGLTHKEKTFGKPNMLLEKNPDPTDTDAAYIRHGVLVKKAESLSKKPMKDLSVSEKDKPNVKSKKRNYKKRRKIAENQERKAKEKKSE